MGKITLLAAIFFYIPLIGAEGHNGTNRVNEKVLPVYRIIKGKITKSVFINPDGLDIKGNVSSLFLDGNILYYLAVQDGSDARIGFVDTSSPVLTTEYKLDEKLLGIVIDKFFVRDGAAYLLTENILYRIGLNTMDMSLKKNVIDAEFVNGNLFLVEQVGEKIVANINGKRLDLSVQAKRITEIVDGRMVFITGGGGTEVIDIHSMRSIYQYPEKGGYLIPEDYNLVLEAIDILTKNSRIDDSRLIFYKIYVDGIETGRTETGPAQVGKSFKFMIKPGRFHIIKAERWALNRRKGRYLRANNLYQPEPQRIFIPENRVIKLDIEYNGTYFMYLKSLLLI